LWLNFNELKTLPKEIGALSNLSHFYLDYNHLDSLPAEIGLLENLDQLSLSRNNLTKLPDEFYNLTGLIYLDVSYAGPLFKLDPKICNFRLLETLVIDQGTLSFSPRCLEIRASSMGRFSIILR
jgi:Leucine-rich repeat (LRR) protein